MCGWPRWSACRRRSCGWSGPATALGTRRGARPRAGGRGRAAVRALLPRHGRAREPALGGGRRPLRGGAAACRRDRAARRRGHLAGRPRTTRARGAGMPQAAEHARTALGLAREFGMPFFEACALHAQGDVAWARGDLAGAVPRSRRRRAVLEEHGLRDPDLSPAPELVEELGARARGRGGRAGGTGGWRTPRPRAGRGRSRARSASGASSRGRRHGARALRRARSSSTAQEEDASSAPAPSCASASGCAGAAAAPTPARRCAPRSPRSTRSARSRGRSARAPSCGRPARPPGGATRPRSTS